MSMMMMNNNTSATHATTTTPTKAIHTIPSHQWTTAPRVGATYAAEFRPTSPAGSRTAATDLLLVSDSAARVLRLLNRSGAELWEVSQGLKRPSAVAVCDHTQTGYIIDDAFSIGRVKLSITGGFAPVVERIAEVPHASAIAVDTMRHRIYVASAHLRKVTVLVPQNRDESRWTVAATWETPRPNVAFGQPVGIAVCDQTGEVWVSDRKAHRVYALDCITGTAVRPDFVSPTMQCPGPIALAGGHLLVADETSRCVLALERQTGVWAGSSLPTPFPPVSIGVSGLITGPCGTVGIFASSCADSSSSSTDDDSLPRPTSPVSCSSFNSSVSGNRKMSTRKMSTHSVDSAQHFISTSPMSHSFQSVTPTASAVFNATAPTAATPVRSAADATMAAAAATGISDDDLDRIAAAVIKRNTQAFHHINQTVDRIFGGHQQSNNATISVCGNNRGNRTDEVLVHEWQKGSPNSSAVHIANLQQQRRAQSMIMSMNMNNNTHRAPVGPIPLQMQLTPPVTATRAPAPAQAPAPRLRVRQNNPYAHNVIGN